MENVRSTLWRLRRLRLAESAHAGYAGEYLHRATNGTGMKRAMDIGGTGRCPLTDNADRYAREKAACEQAKREADEIWNAIRPKLEKLDLDHRGVIELFYNVGIPWEGVPAAIKRSRKACERMHDETLRHLEREAT